MWHWDTATQNVIIREEEIVIFQIVKAFHGCVLSPILGG